MTGKRLLIVIPNGPIRDKLDVLLKSAEFGYRIEILASNNKEAYILMFDTLPKETKELIEELERQKLLRVIDLYLAKGVKKARESVIER